MTPPQYEGGAWISPGDVFVRLERLTEALIRLETKISSDDTPSEIVDLKSRVTALERLVWKAVGATTAVGGLIGWAVSWLSNQH